MQAVKTQRPLSTPGQSGGKPKIFSQVLRNILFARNEADAVDSRRKGLYWEFTYPGLGGWHIHWIHKNIKNGHSTNRAQSMFATTKTEGVGSDHSRIWSQPGRAVPGSHLPTGHIGQLNRAQSKASAGPMHSKFRTPSPSEHSHVVPKHQLRRSPPKNFFFK